jgi:hypothetical protein
MVGCLIKSGALEKPLYINSSQLYMDFTWRVSIKLRPYVTNFALMPNLDPFPKAPLGPFPHDITINKNNVSV